MGGFGAAVMLVLAGWAALDPGTMAWVYIGALIAFELWLARRVAAAGSAPVAAGEPPYHFTAEEAELVGRYRFYFTYPRAAREASPVFAAARFTKAVAPLMVLGMAASRGDRAALRLLESHDPAWSKIRASKEVS